IPLGALRVLQEGRRDRPCRRAPRLSRTRVPFVRPLIVDYGIRMRIPTGRLAPSRRRVPFLAAATCMTLLAGCAQSVTGSPLRGETPPATTSQSAAATATDWPALPDLPTTSTPPPGTTPPDADQTEGGVIPGPPEVTDDQVGLLPGAPT